MGVAATALLAAGSPAAPQSVSAFGLLAQMLIGLGVILGLIALISRVARGRGVAGLRLGGGRAAALTVVARQHYGKGVCVTVVQAGGRLFLLGVTPTGITRIAELPAGSVEIPDSQPAGTGRPADAGPRGLAALLGGTHHRTTTRPTWTSAFAEQLRAMTTRR